MQSPKQYYPNGEPKSFKNKLLVSLKKKISSERSTGNELLTMC